MTDRDSKSSRAGKPGELKGSWHRIGLKENVEVPIGVEKILLRAAMNDKFKQRLLDDRERAIDESGLELTSTERAMLVVMPQSVLEAMAQRLNPSRQMNTRVARGVAAAVASSIILTASGYCCGGSGPDDGYSDADTDTSSDTDTFSDTDTDTDTDTDVDTDVDVDAGEDAGYDGGGDAGDDAG